MSRNWFKPAATLFALALGTAVVGCADHALPSEPAAALTESGTTALSVAEEVKVLTRTTAIPLMSASARIGAAGGTIEIRDAGLRVRFPEGALQVSGNQTVKITVTAIAGDVIAYDFEPHGLVFNKPVVLEQDYKITGAWKNTALLDQVKGAYFPLNSNLDVRKKTALVTEYQPITVDVLGSKIRFGVHHFSGYVVSSGRAEAGAW
jgi:hypothetical protein